MFPPHARDYFVERISYLVAARLFTACRDRLAAVIPHIHERTASLIERDHRGTLSAAHIALVI
ncbi:hypothetical protein [Streptomyces sp. NBC_00872]|uniref:hypothetical protein n=1 Tax=Streptomyces sp. NBC_00872 TaxID=2903686 RepID=UPI003866984F|nr:hypothetical protein OG214_22945 [Streptomyces sp. NBC_00872]